MNNEIENSWVFLGPGFYAKKSFCNDNGIELGFGDDPEFISSKISLDKDSTIRLFIWLKYNLDWVLNFHLTTINKNDESKEMDFVLHGQIITPRYTAKVIDGVITELKLRSTSLIVDEKSTNKEE